MEALRGECDGMVIAENLLKKTSFIATESENPLTRHYIVILSNLVFLEDENSIEMDIQNENSEISLSSWSYFVQLDSESFF